MKEGWICPRCGRVYAPDTKECTWCNTITYQYDWLYHESQTSIPPACRHCSNHPSNGGSGICNCTLGSMIIT